MAESSFLSRAWVCSLLAGVGAIVLPSIVLAQAFPSNIVPDATLGAESSQVIQNFGGLPVEAIGGGAQRGQNLFHSFSQFNVSTGRGAYFAIQNNAVRNVLTRVTGSNISDIQGTLGTFRAIDGIVRVPGVNLFLINPNGIVFGENASLDVGGSFFATTANAVKLGDTGLFSASEPEPSNLLTVDPSAFLFNTITNQNLPGIVVRSRATSTILGNPTIGLLVPGSQRLVLLGGNLVLDGGVALALAGRVELGGLAAPGTIDLNGSGNNLSLSFPDAVTRSNITLTNQASVNATNGGGIDINAEYLNVERNSRIGAFKIQGLGTSTGQAGEITLNVAQSVVVTNSTIGSSTEPNAGSILGNGSNILVQAGSLELRDGAQISASTSTGNAGTIVIKVNGAVSLDGISANGFPGGILNFVEPSGQGTGGNVVLQAGSLSVSNGAQVNASTFGRGNAGNVLILVKGSTALSGEGANSLSTGLSNSVGTGAVGNGGNIELLTGNLSVTNGAQIDVSTSGQGNAGNLDIYGLSISLSGVSSKGFSSGLFARVSPNGVGNGGDIDVIAGKLNVTRGAQISTSTSGKGDGGNINIQAFDDVVLIGGGKTNLSSFISSGVESGAFGSGGNIRLTTDRSLIMKDGFQISSRSSGSGNGGDIDIFARHNLTADNSSITAISTNFTGGNINIGARSILLRGNSDITTSSLTGRGRGSNIQLAARTIVALNDSDILAFTADGLGGNIILNSPAFFGQNYRASAETDPRTLDGNNRVDVNASGVVSGFITFSDTNIPTQVSPSLIDPNTLLATSCIVRSHEQNGSFFVTGSGGLPVRPGDAPPASFPTGEVRSLPAPQSQNDRPWQPGDAIVEPQGIYRLPNGKLVMSRECQTQ